MIVRRREFIKHLAAIFAITGSTTAACSQGTDEPRRAGVSDGPRTLRGMPVIGFLSSGSPSSFKNFLGAFRQGLTDQGFVEGRNVLIEYRWAEGRYLELDSLAADLVERQVDILIATGGATTAHAAKRATVTIPVLFVTGYDPVKLGLVTSIGRPEGNITGATILTTELSAKRLELLTELAAGKNAVALLVNPQAITTDIEANDIMASAKILNKTLFVFKASNDAEIEAAFASMAEHQVPARF